MTKKPAAPATPTPITKMDGNTCDVLRPVINEALKAALAPYGVTGTIGKITYHETGFRTTLEVETAANDEVQFQRLVVNNPGVKMEWFGRTFDLKGEQYRVAGADLGCSKFPVQIQRVSDGQILGYTVNGLRATFGWEDLEAERAKKFPANLDFVLQNYKSLNIIGDGDYGSLVPHAAALAVGSELSGLGVVVGLADHPFESKFKKNRIVIKRQDGTSGYLALPKLVAYLNSLPKTAAA